MAARLRPPETRPTVRRVSLPDARRRTPPAPGRPAPLESLPSVLRLAPRGRPARSPALRRPGGGPGQPAEGTSALLLQPSQLDRPVPPVRHPAAPAPALFLRSEGG